MRDEWLGRFAHFDEAPLYSWLLATLLICHRRHRWCTLILNWRENGRGARVTEETRESCHVLSAWGFVSRTVEKWGGIKTSWLILTLLSSCFFAKRETERDQEKGLEMPRRLCRTWECVQPVLSAYCVHSVLFQSFKPEWATQFFFYFRFKNTENLWLVDFIDLTHSSHASISNCACMYYMSPDCDRLFFLLKYYSSAKWYQGFLSCYISFNFCFISEFLLNLATFYGWEI